MLECFFLPTNGKQVIRKIQKCPSSYFLQDVTLGYVWKFSYTHMTFKNLNNKQSTPQTIHPVTGMGGGNQNKWREGGSGFQ